MRPAVQAPVGAYRTNSTVESQAPAKSPLRFAARIRPSDLRLDERVREVYLALTERPSVRAALVAISGIWYRMRRTDDGFRPLATVSEQLVDHANAGGTEAEARRVEIHVHQVIDECHSGSNHRTFDELDLEEELLDGREDFLTMKRRVDGETPELLREAIEIDEREAAVQIERARLSRRRLREIERGRR